METIRFYKNGKLLYELHKINNLYVLTDIKFGKSKSFNEIPPELENLLPEGVNKELFAIKHNISIHNKFKLLKYLDDTFGRISTTNIEKKEIEFDLNINSYDEAIKFVEDFEIEDVLLESFEFSMTPREKKIHLSYLSGQQPKATIIVNQNSIRFAKKDEYSNAILKYSNKDFYLINVVENMFLNFARFELGFEVMPTFLLIDRQLRKSEFLRDTTDLFITKRFDDRNKDYFEINSLLGYTSEEKYEISVEEIFEKMQNFLDKKEIEKLAKVYYFNYLIGNGDAHAKNFSVIQENDKYKLAPLYDVVNTQIYGFNYPLGIPLYKNSKDENFKEEELISLLNDYIEKEKLLEIKNMLKNKIKDYINKTPFKLFENGEKIKNKLIDFFKNRNLIIDYQTDNRIEELNEIINTNSELFTDELKQLNNLKLNPNEQELEKLTDIIANKLGIEIKSLNEVEIKELDNKPNQNKKPKP